MRRSLLLLLSFMVLLFSACAPTVSTVGAGYARGTSGGASPHAAAAAVATTAAGTAVATAMQTAAQTATARPAATPYITPAPASASAGTTQSVWETFYAAVDNDPPGSLGIAYPAPQGIHAHAGGVGSYADPITLASDARWLPVGARVYAPRWRKYYIMEDECVACEADWSTSHFHHVDLFMPPSLSAGVLACESAATKDQAENDTIILNPAPNLPVDTTPLYTDASGCVVAAHQY